MSFLCSYKNFLPVAMSLKLYANKDYMQLVDFLNSRGINP